MAGRVAALAKALDRLLWCQSCAPTLHRSLRETVGILRQDVQWLSKASVRDFSNFDGGENGEKKNGGESHKSIPQEEETLQSVVGEGSRSNKVRSVSEPAVPGGENQAFEYARTSVNAAAVESHNTDDFRRSVGINRGHASPNSEGPVDFGSRLSKLNEDDLDNLIAFKNFKGILGLPPLETILAQDDEQERRAKRREAERRKQEETKRSRVKQVDDLGRAYATGKRKTSIARVWLMEGQGNIIINGKTHDLYFLDMDKRVQLLEPFVITNTLGAFDVKSTVKGGGVSGQSGALRHGISKALQLFDPALRPALKSEGMLTRDDRIVERKKPGKAKARKSFQWVKR